MFFDFADSTFVCLRFVALGFYRFTDLKYVCLRFMGHGLYVDGLGEFVFCDISVCMHAGNYSSDGEAVTSIFIKKIEFYISGIRQD